MGYYSDNTKSNKLSTRLNNKTTHNMWCVVPYLASIVNAIASREGADASAREGASSQSHEIRLRGLGSARLAVAFEAVSSARHSKKFH